MANKFAKVTGFTKVFNAIDESTLNITSIKDGITNISNDSILFLIATIDDEQYGYNEGDKYIWMNGELFGGGSGKGSGALEIHDDDSEETNRVIDTIDLENYSSFMLNGQLMKQAYTIKNFDNDDSHDYHGQQNILLLASANNNWATDKTVLHKQDPEFSSYLEYMFNKFPQPEQLYVYIILTENDKKVGKLVQHFSGKYIPSRYLPLLGCINLKKYKNKKRMHKNTHYVHNIKPEYAISQHNVIRQGAHVLVTKLMHYNQTRWCYLEKKMYDVQQQFDKQGDNKIVFREEFVGSVIDSLYNNIYKTAGEQNASIIICPVTNRLNIGIQMSTYSNKFNDNYTTDTYTSIKLKTLIDNPSTIIQCPDDLYNCYIYFPVILTDFTGYIIYNKKIWPRDESAGQYRMYGKKRGVIYDNNSGRYIGLGIQLVGKTLNYSRTEVARHGAFVNPYTSVMNDLYRYYNKNFNMQYLKNIYLDVKDLSIEDFVNFYGNANNFFNYQILSYHSGRTRKIAGSTVVPYTKNTRTTYKWKPFVVNSKFTKFINPIIKNVIDYGTAPKDVSTQDLVNAFKYRILSIFFKHSYWDWYNQDNITPIASYLGNWEDSKDYKYLYIAIFPRQLTNTETKSSYRSKIKGYTSRVGELFKIQLKMTRQEIMDMRKAYNDNPEINTMWNIIIDKIRIVNKGTITHPFKI